MSITVITRMSDSDEKPHTIGEIFSIGKNYRHPDSVLVSYPNAAKNTLGSFPKNKDYKIAIIGAGASGIASLYELSRIARNQNSGKINVTLYESDYNNFIKLKNSISPRNLDFYGKRAGRVFAARSREREEKDHSVYEIGAMRFPEIAGLTWHYASIAFGDDKSVEIFPNPGKVPTEFVFGDRVDRYVYKNGTEYWLDGNSPTKVIKDIIKEGLAGTEKEPNISLYPIGCKDPIKISNELKNKDTTKVRLKEIQQQWKNFVNAHDSITLESAVRRIVKEKVKCLPQIAGVEKEEDKINYYVELFGCFGFGTGGFKSIFNISLIEMMRLILWDYSNEYMLPVEENVQFFSNLYDKACKDNSKFVVNVEHARVCDVCHSGSGDGVKAIVFDYKIRDSDAKEENCITRGEYDFAILAIPPKQLSAVVSRAGFNNTERNIKFGDYVGDHDQTMINEVLARPPLILSNSNETPNANIITAINQVHMVTSSKVFGTIKASNFNKISPELTIGEKFGKIKAIVSDCGLASSYIVPSPIKVSGKKTLSSEPEYYSFLISYAWEDDTKKILGKFNVYPMNSEYLDVTKLDKNEQMINSIINHTIRDIKEPLEKVYKRWWLGDLLTTAKKANALTDMLSYDWTTNHTAGAFKLDMTGGYYNSHLCFRYHTHALNPNLYNRFFLANDSYSHLGGWLEGAFMSAINAVSGIIVAANGGGSNGLNALTTEARGIIESLEQIASNDSI